jgi:hypothetical protein
MNDQTVTFQEMDVDPIAKPKGRSMIEFKVALWTDKVNENERPRECRSSGKVTRSANASHGIRYGERNFNTVAEIGPAIEKLAAEAGITIHPSAKAKAYAQTRDSQGRRIFEEAILPITEEDEILGQISPGEG